MLFLLLLLLQMLLLLLLLLLPKILPSSPLPCSCNPPSLPPSFFPSYLIDDAAALALCASIESFAF